MTNRDDGRTRELYQDGESSVVNKMEDFREGQQIVYESEDDGFLIGGPNQYRGKITEVISNRSIVIVDGVQEVPLDRIVSIDS